MQLDDGRIIVRWQDQPEDLPKLEALFSRAFPDELWLPEDFVKFRTKEDSNNVIKLAIGHPADDNRDVLYAGVLYSVDAKQVRIRRIVVDPAYRRLGIGSYLMSFLIGERSGIRRGRFIAKVPEDNLTGQLFLRSLQFAVPRNGIVKKGNKPVQYSFEHLKRVAAPMAVV